ncbi:hypothetical protein [uncultured Rhodoblastus sp.]|uniref:hypothetical protein n=1 Tax=uncultured Rhodoblastus sp. TaxID=543037 RepID=UPI0025D6FEDE|nr:hypothetical protein [uncultured Rhodoblastus sp.]
MIAARFPDKFNSLVLAGARMNTDAGNEPIIKWRTKRRFRFIAISSRSAAG